MAALNPMVVVAGAAAGLLLAMQRSATSNATGDEQAADGIALDAGGFGGMLTAAGADVQGIVNAVAGTDAAGMRTSAAGLQAIQQWERLSLTPYRLGDGGTTIGWGRYYPDSGPPPPDRITQATAEEWFAIDVRLQPEPGQLQEHRPGGERRARPRGRRAAIRAGGQ